LTRALLGGRLLYVCLADRLPRLSVTELPSYDRDKPYRTTAFQVQPWVLLVAHAVLLFSPNTRHVETALAIAPNPCSPKPTRSCYRNVDGHVSHWIVSSGVYYDLLYLSPPSRYNILWSTQSRVARSGIDDTTHYQGSAFFGG